MIPLGDWFGVGTEGDQREGTKAGEEHGDPGHAEQVPAARGQEGPGRARDTGADFSGEGSPSLLSPDKRE